MQFTAIYAITAAFIQSCEFEFMKMSEIMVLEGVTKKCYTPTTLYRLLGSVPYCGLIGFLRCLHINNKRKNLKSRETILQ
jgi:hypothetical protein